MGKNRERQNEEEDESQEETENDYEREEKDLNNVKKKKRKTRKQKETENDCEGEEDLNNVKKRKRKTRKQKETDSKDKAVNSNEQNPQPPETNAPITRSKSQNKFKHACDKCFKSFHTTLGLKRHKRNHSKGDKTKRHVCPHCDKSFSCLSYLEVTLFFSSCVMGLVKLFVLRSLWLNKIWKLQWTTCRHVLLV